MKKFANFPWMAFACLLMELLALIFVTLMLICPAPFEHSNLAVIVVQPTINSSIANSTSPIFNNSTSSSGSSSTLPPLNISSTSSVSNSTSSTSAPVSSITSSLRNNTASSNTSSTSPHASTATTDEMRTASATPAATTLVKREIIDNSTYPGRFKQSERLDNQTESALLNGTAATTQNNNSTLLLRIGPLGSCFRTSDNVETCTSAKLNSKYDFTLLQGAGFITSGLPSGMSTYPLVLLILVIFLTLKVAFDATVTFLPENQLPYSFSSLSSGWQIGSNWLVSGATIVLAVATGIQRTKMSTAVKNFNTANQTFTMDSIPLFAETGTSFGFVWIATILLAAVFFCKRIAIKRHVITERAKMELLAHSDAAKYSSQAPLPLYRAASYEDTLTAHQTNRRSGLALLRDLLNSSSKGTSDSHKRPPAAASDISLPTIVLDDYLRRHYHHHHHDQEEVVLPRAPSSVEYLSDYRMQAKESPPFSAYQSSLGSEGKAKEEARYVEDVRQKMASPAPSYWTMSERAQDFQARREKEREYMAELRKQRSLR